MLMLSTLLVSGCTAPTVTVTLTLDADHPTAVRTTVTGGGNCALSWSAMDPAGHGHEITDQPAPESGTLLGIPAGWTVNASASCSGGDYDHFGGHASITTASLPSTVPHLVLDGSTPAISEPYILTSTFDVNQGATLVMETLSGDVVWWEALPTDHIATAAHYDAANQQIYAVEATPDGVGADFMIASLAGPTQRWAVTNAHHDSLLLGDGRYLLTVSEERTIDGDLILGDDLVAFDTADGSTEVLWSAFDQLPIVQNDGWNLRTPDGAADWTHINGLYQDPATGKIYASLYHDHSILQIDATTWQTDWILGGPSTQFSVDLGFGPQHSPFHSGNTLWMFDNGTDVTAGSRLLAYSLDETAMTATRSWMYQADPPVFDVILGSIALTDDATIASWGDVGQVRILDSTDAVLGSYTLDALDQVGYTSLVAGF